MPTRLGSSQTLLYYGTNSDSDGEIWQAQLSGSSWSGADVEGSVTGLSNGVGTYGGGGPVTITGTGFTGATAV